MKTKLQKQNERFQKASPAEKRVMIAKDVIKQIKLGKYKADHWTYVGSDKIADITDDSKSIQEIINEPTFQCECCALGSLMLSCTLFNNNQTRASYWEDFVRLGNAIRENKKLPNGLNKFFTKKQLLKIEVAYELFDCGVRSKAYKFGKKYTSGEPRLIGIMKNIVKNNGDFKP